MWAAKLTDPDGHRLALFGARLSSGSANRPYATLSVNDSSVRVTSGKPVMVQSPQRRPEQSRWAADAGAWAAMFGES
jgi:hypothetical protein